jgi:hypothetical protein
VIAERLSPNARVATQIHELAHALVDVDREAEDPKLGHAEEELIAESVVFCPSRPGTAVAPGRSVRNKRHRRCVEPDARPVLSAPKGQ